MNCPQCNGKLRRVLVSIQGAKAKAVSMQCSTCDYVSFESSSTRKVLDELSPLKIKQQIVKLSADRLGIYFNSHVVRSLGLKKGESIYVSVPDKKHIILEIE